MLTRRVSVLALLCMTAVACGDDVRTLQNATATPTSAPPTSTPVPRAVAKRIDDAADLIGGALAIGRVGDFLIANDKVRAIVRAPGREMSLALLYGGNIVDADIVRPPGEPGRDNFGGMLPDVNLSLTVNVQEVVVVNDGSNGEPAVLRAVGVDDLLDAFDLVNAIKAFGFGMVPESAQDRDLPLEIATEYTLAVGGEAIRIETVIMNTGGEDLRLYVGDLMNASGEDDTFVPPAGFGDALLYTDLPYVAYTGRGANEGIAYGILPLPIDGTSITATGFGQSGIMGVLFGQSFLDVLLGQEPGALAIPAGEARSYVRYFAIGDGDAGSIADIRNALLEIPTGTLHGRVTAAGEPAPGAFVSVVQRPGDGDAPYKVLNGFRTDADGRFMGSMPPGEYLLMAKLDGYPYDSGATTPLEHPVAVAAGIGTELDIALPPTSGLRVVVTDADGNPLPAKATVVGHDPAPEPANGAGTFIFRANVSDQGNVLFGITAVRFIDVSGDSGVFSLPPSDYEVVVSRGPEYSVHRERVRLSAGVTGTVNARLARVLETDGFVAADYHVHMIHSWDCSVTRDDRIRTMAAEGVDYFVASDHDAVTDLRPDIARLGLADHLASAVGSEVTTFNVGHFNVWPMERDADSYTGGSIDWGRAGVEPGRDFPSLGSYDLSPAELFATARERVDDSDGGVIQLNHFNSGTLGFFAITGIDTAVDPPQSFTPLELIRQDPAIDNVYDDDFDTLEVWIEATRAQTSAFQDANLGDWFNLLNQGRIKAATANSDTHSTAVVQAGGPRNFVASSVDAPAELDDGELAASVRDGRTIGTNAPFLTVAVEGDDGAVAELGISAPTLVAATNGAATVRVRVQSPVWAEFDTIEIFANTVPNAVPDRNMHGVEVPRYAVAPTMVLRVGADFDVEEVIVDSTIPGASRLEADVEIPLAVERDTWVVVLVKGSDAVSRPLWPMNPQDLDTDDNGTLDDLTDGNLGEGGNPALAFSNPLFIDADGDGRFNPAVEMP